MNTNCPQDLHYALKDRPLGITQLLKQTGEDAIYLSQELLRVDAEEVVHPHQGVFHNCILLVEHLLYDREEVGKVPRSGLHLLHDLQKGLVDLLSRTPELLIPMVEPTEDGFEYLRNTGKHRILELICVVLYGFHVRDRTLVLVVYGLQEHLQVLVDPDECRKARESSILIAYHYEDVYALTRYPVVVIGGRTDLL